MKTFNISIRTATGARLEVPVIARSTVEAIVHVTRALGSIPARVFARPAHG